MPAPACTLGREGEILLLWKSWGGGSPPALQEAGCRLPPSPALELLLPWPGAGAAQAPPRAGRTVPPQLGAACTAGHTDVARCLPLL